MTITDIIFFALAALVVVSGAGAAFARNIIHAAFALFFTLMGMAGLFYLMGADFLAVTQIVIYVGGILILLIFGITLTHRSMERLRIERPVHFAIGFAVGAALFGAMLAVILTAFPAGPAAPPLPAPAPTTAPLGQLLLTDYLLPFEFASITLLMALIGAAYLVRRRDPK